MSEIEKLEEEFNKGREGTGLPTDVKPEEVVEEVVEEASPPGFLSYDEYVAKGNDPKGYKGEDAYSAEYERIQEVKGLKTQIRQIGDSMNEWQQQQREQTRLQLEAELVAARTDEDVDKALSVQKQIDSIPAASQQEDERIVAFRAANPIIDTSSSEFNEDFNNDVQSIFNSRIRDFPNPTESQIQKVLGLAMDNAKQMNPDLFTSPKNKRSAPAPQSKVPGESTDTTAQLRQVRINSRNPGNATAAVDVRDFLKEKYGEDFDEEAFTKNITGEQ